MILFGYFCSINEMKAMKKLSLILSLLLLTGELFAQNRSGHDQFPTFRGGSVRDFGVWFASAYQHECRQYKKRAGKEVEQESTTIQFYVDTLGRSQFIGVSEPIPAEQEELIRTVLNKAPYWRPGIQGGKKKKVKFTVPLRINK